MLVKIGNASDIAEGQMRVFDVAGTRVNVANASGHLYAFDDTCTHMGCSLANGDLDGDTTLSTFEMAVGSDGTNTLYHSRGFYVSDEME